MWPVSAQFLEALRGPHKLRTTVTVTVPGGVAVPVELISGTISVDASSRIRRTGSLNLFGNQAVYDMVSTPGAVVRVLHGLSYGRAEELVPVLTGELSSPAQQIGTGSISVRLVDFGQRVARSRFLSPYSPAAGTSRTTVIGQVVSDAVSTTVTNISTDTGTLAGGRTWNENRWDVVTDLALDGGTEAYFTPDGLFTIRNAPQITDPAVWTINAGEGGVLIAAVRERPLDRLYNTVIVRPSATDGTQTWTQQKVQITDPTDPLHPSKVGEATYFYSSPTASSASAAVAAGQRILERVTGLQESLNISAMSNPALDANDVIRIITPRTGVDAAETFQHFVDSLSLDLASGAMTIRTRSLGVANA